MFKSLGRAITRHPVAVTVAWIVLVALSSAAFLWGFGEGGLFQRMETSEYSVPGSESETVMHLVDHTDDSSGDQALLVVTGVDTDDEKVATFARDHRDLFDGNHVESVTDVFTIDEAVAAAEKEAAEEMEAAIEEQTELALAPVAEQIEQEAAAASTQLEEQAAQVAQLPEPARAAAEEELQAAREELAASTEAALEEAGAQVAAQVQEEVQAQAVEAEQHPDVIAEREEAESQRDALVPKNQQGYVVIVERQAGLDGEAAEQARADLDEATEAYGEALGITFPGAQIEEMSQERIEGAIMDMVQADLVTGEAFGLPVAALLMIIIFGGALAAGMPLVGAISAILAGMGALWVSTFVTTIDSFILNVVSIIGVALSIDYGLLVVSRYREESQILRESIGEGRLSRSPAALKRRVVIPAVRTTVQTAGRTVLFSAVTIALSLVGLLLIRIHMLQMIAWGGIIVTLLAVLAAITLVPALLTMLGVKLLKPSPITKVPGVRKIVAAVGDTSTDHGVFYRLARWDEKRPWIVMLGAALILILMASPVKNLELRNNFADYIPSGTGLSLAYDTVQEEYSMLSTPSVTGVVDAPEGSDEALAAVEEVESIAGVSEVQVSPLDGDDEKSVLRVHVDADDQVGKQVTDVVLDMRALDVDAQVWVGGAAATQYDFTQAIVKDTPRALTVVFASVMVLLFLMTGSVVVPIRALIINSLSLLASLGITTAIFQNGWLGVPQSNGLETFIVACMVAFGFGLAMDYEVFLLARIKEYWDAGDDNDTAVAKGLQRSGRIITSAAAIIVAVFIGFALGDMIAIKQIGVALAVMVVTDATLTRLFLVPSAMAILGKWNWWAPKPLAKLADKIGLRE